MAHTTTSAVDIMRYNQDALASQTQVFDKVRSHAQAFKSSLPIGRTIIEVGIQTEATPGQVHRVAVMAFNNTNSTGAISFYVSFHKYQERGQLPPPNVEDKSAAIASSTAMVSSSSIGTDRQCVQVTPTSKALSLHSMAFGCGIGPKTNYPDKVLSAYETVFGHSLPIPGDGSKVVKTFFYITTLTPTPDECIRYYGYSNVNKLGEMWVEKIVFEQEDCGKGLEITKCPKDALDSRHPGYKKLFDEFVYSLQVAQGRAIPMSIPASAKGASVAGQGIMPPDQRLQQLARP